MFWLERMRSKVPRRVHILPDAVDTTLPRLDRQCIHELHAPDFLRPGGRRELHGQDAVAASHIEKAWIRPSAYEPLPQSVAPGKTVVKRLRCDVFE
jgi:hypothetical protein